MQLIAYAFVLCGLCGSLFCTALPTLSSSTSEFDKAVSLYNQGHYADACKLIRTVSEKEPSNSHAQYYYALCLHRLGKLNEAKAQYKKVVTKFQGSIAAEQSAQAAAALESDSASTGIRPKFAFPVVKEQSTLPAEARIYFTRENDSIILNALVNNRPAKMLFDTGAEICTFGKNHLQELGIPEPTGAPDEKSTTVGGRQSVASWQMEANLSVGSIRKPHCQISVLEFMEGEPLLGQNFFKDLNYTIENTANCIRFTKKSAGTAHKSGYGKEWNVVPFVRYGDQMIVNAEVNGKSCQMVFDTGAARTCFTYKQLKQLQIEVPPDAEMETRVGASGRMTAFTFSIDRVKLGPMDKKNLKISAVFADLPYPLLGQNFYNDYEYSVDSAARCIRFNRR